MKTAHYALGHLKARYNLKYIKKKTLLFEIFKTPVSMPELFSVLGKEKRNMNSTDISSEVKSGLI